MEITADNLEQQAEHAETLIQGLQDTISGSEGMNLTEAQHYLHGVLYANGGASIHVAGNEGVLESIKNGLMKVWQVISDAFKKVWNYFFGGKDTAAKVKEIKEDAQKKPPQPELKLEVNEEKRKALADSIDALADAYTKFSDEHGDDFVRSGEIEVMVSSATISGLKHDLKHIASDVREATTASSVKETNAAVVRMLPKAEKMFKDVKNALQRTQEELKDVESSISKMRDSDVKDKLNQKLKGLKVTVTYINAAAKLEQQTLAAMQRLVDDNNRLFGIK